MIEKMNQWLFPREQDDRLLAFEKVYREHRSYIRSTIYWMVRNEQVDDLVQEVFVKAWKSYSGFKEESAIRTWLYRIARNTVIDFYRREDREVLPWQGESRSEPDEILVETITIALKTLTLNHRETFVLFYKFGHTLEEIAELTDTKKGTVKSRLHTAREQVKEILEKNGVGNG